MLAISRIRKRVKAALWPQVGSWLPWNCQMSYSQFGEDMILSWLFRPKRSPGFYLDIGAYHPVALSNTYGLYCKGWRGICVEPRPGAIDEFKLYRPRDVSLQLAVTATPADHIDFYIFNEQSLNTTDLQDAEGSLARGKKLLSRC